MKKITLTIFLWSIFCGTPFCLNTAHANVQVMDNTNQIVNDEGYGNDDAEYYNAEDDLANVEDPNKSSTNSQD